MTENQIHPPQWTSNWAFILVLSGFVIGLGNAWRFPYLAGENGGSVFILIYLLFVIAMGVPIMMAETMLGRAAARSPVNGIRFIAKNAGGSVLWQFFGWMVGVIGFLILSYYSVIVGWLLVYTTRMAAGVFTGVEADHITTLFAELVSDPERILAWHTIFMVAVISVSARGVNRGLEWSMKFLVPIILVLLVGLVAWVSRYETFQQSVSYLFAPDFSKITLETVFAALTHAFFSLGIGVGAIMVYGIYVPKSKPIGVCVVSTALMDAGVGVLAGLAVLPLIFAYSLETITGPKLVFQVLPLAFGQMPSGHIFGGVFFLVLVLAAFTTAVALLEPLVAWLVNRGKTRVWSATAVGMVNWLFGIAGILSFGFWSFEFEFFGQAKANGVFDILDMVTSYFLLPLSGLLICIFSAYTMSRDYSEREFGLKYYLDYVLWRFASRYIAPVFVTILLVYLLFGHIFGSSE